MTQQLIYDPACWRVLLDYARKTRRYSLQSLAQRIQDVSGIVVSDSQLSALATGKSRNPAFTLVVAFCYALGASTTIFTEADGVERFLVDQRTANRIAPDPLFSFDAERLRWLFENIKTSEGKKHSQTTLVASVNALGVELSESQLSALIRGKSTNPAFALVSAICSAFGVKVTVFSEADGLTAIQEELALLEAMKRRELSYLTLRASELSHDEVAQITNIVEMLTRKKQRTPRERRETSSGD